MIGLFVREGDINLQGSYGLAKIMQRNSLEYFTILQPASETN